jgi:hypothetical protein
LIGTVLATNLIKNEVPLDWYGIMGNFAAASFTTTMFTANRVAIEISFQRSLYMLLERSDSLFIFGSNTNAPYNFDIFLNGNCFGPLAP